ncbi:methionyl-tRNA synthetase [Frankia casuarinae]|nr:MULTISPECIES: methionine--tRNA ligase [Frankia]ETA04414.1 methionyl-tRNA synthetase [Frankia sp. CcI6]EYT90404.1 methionyl-tRNA synthetase [Frankia casuarinae]KDA44887.1 methionyl-tRNA synthetase [Frankia sp. BMG5.23]KEZ38085.1 methionyl-tRNA synthetase [Frankia sp. CeD]OHV50827.1 methionine--tRNA ligase [Frankia sp. CgIS1]
MGRYFVTTAIPYVNGKPHVGHALELIETDAYARHLRQRGHEVRFQTGTDDNALKNVQAAEAEGITPAEYVERVATGFVGLRGPLGLSFDDFIKTSTDPRHRPGVEKLWSACADRGDFYRKTYAGLYCVGCELFYQPDELVDGRCPEHGTVPDLVEESNWFFRLGRYQDQLHALISTDRLRIEPAARKREVLSFIEAGLEDFSASRSMSRARGWGIPVPGDPEQVIYVWFDALGNYITAPGYGNDDDSFQYWWNDADRRVHVIGKGIIRFHAVYWPAMLLSAGVRLPDTIFVHEYLTADSMKISKSAGNAEDPADIVAAFNTDALRWWMLRDVARAGDTDYTTERLVTRANEDLANNIGNLVNRTVSMVKRYRDGLIPPLALDNPAAAKLRAVRDETPRTIDDAFAAFDFRRAAEVITRIGDEGNRYVEAARPWELAKAERKEGASRDALDAVLAELVATCRELAEHLAPFLPDSAPRIAAQCGDGGSRVAGPSPVFPRLEAPPAEPATT